MSESKNSELYKTVDHLFRHEAGKMVSVLTRVFGFSNIEDAEDIVQDTIIKAMEIWKWSKIPDNPQAWLYRTAKNKAIDILRRKKLRYKIENDLAVLLQSEYTLVPKLNEMFTEGEIRDSQLRMMFACCHPSISTEAQVTLILKTLCGLSIKEISNAFLTNEETINKRLYRAKEKLRSEKNVIDFSETQGNVTGTSTVLQALYLLFNEGYNSSHPEKLIREDLCEEAIRLTILLTENSNTNLPQTNALLALMCYQASRFDSRLDDKGMIILLKEQDRTQWNKKLILKGNEYLNHATASIFVHDFLIEAGIASIHANSKSFEETNWKLILSLYNILHLHTNNPIVNLNRCLVLAEVDGTDKAISELEKVEDLSQNCYYHASLGELYLKKENKNEAKKYFGKALELTNSNAEIELIQRKISLCQG